jgi:hypothetical protein
VVDPSVIGTALPRSERDILVHGTAAQVEFENSGPPNTIQYRGWGAVVVAQAQHAWVHLPIPVPVDIPTPVAVGGATPFSDLGRLVRLEAHYEVPPAGEVRNLHLWDGGNRFFFWDFPDTHPSSLQVGSTKLMWHGNHALANSLGVSVGVIFPTAIDSPEPPSSFTLFSARAHLE